MRWGRWALLAVLAVSCGGSPAYRGRAAALAESGQLQAAIEELRFALARHPGDGAAHAALARLQDRAGRPGAALRHFAAARERGALAGDDRSRLAALYLERARARVALGDAAANEDLTAAEALSGGIASAETALAVDVHRLAALAAMRAGGPDDLKRARSHLRRLAELAPDEPRVALLAPDAAELVALGVAARWLYDAGARRQGREMLARYVRSGGRANGVVARWLDAERWWRGRHATLSEATVDAAARQGVDVCAIAYRPSDRDCAARVLDSGVLDDVGASARLWRRAARLHWRTAEAPLAAWVAAQALREWVAGREPSWLGALTARVDVDSLALERVPLFAAPTLARARGDADAAARLLERALAAAARWSPHQRAVVFGEAALQGRGAAALAELALSGPVPEYAWVVGASAARARGDRAAELESLQHAGSFAFDYLAGHGELALLAARLGNRRIGVRFADAYARWYEALGHRAVTAGRAAILARGADGGEPPAPPVARFGDVDVYPIAAAHGVHQRAVADGLARVAAHYARDPALADRTARDFIDEARAEGERVPALVALWLELGDARRAHAWALDLLETSARHPAYLELAGEAAAAAGDLAQADVHFVAAAATSGDGGASSTRAARAYARYGHALAAIGAARRALEQTAAGEEHAVLLLLVRAMRQLGRDDDAGLALARYIERIPEPFRALAGHAVRGAWGDGAVPGELPAVRAVGRRAVRIAAGESAAEWALDPTDAGLALAYAATLADADPERARASLDAAIAWNSGHVALRAARLALSSPTEARYQELVGELLAIAVTARGERRAAALDVLIPIFEQLGASELAAAATRERARR